MSTTATTATNNTHNNKNNNSSSSRWSTAGGARQVEQQQQVIEEEAADSGSWCLISPLRGVPITSRCGDTTTTATTTTTTERQGATGGTHSCWTCSVARRRSQRCIPTFSRADSTATCRAPHNTTQYRTARQRVWGQYTGQQALWRWLRTIGALKPSVWWKASSAAHKEMTCR